MNLECDVVFADRLRPSDYDLIVVPALYCVKESLLWSWRHFTESGRTTLNGEKVSYFAELLKPEGQKIE